MMRRIVLDTNCLIQIIPRKSKYRHIWDAYQKGLLRLCVSTEILNEYHEILSTLANVRIADNIIGFIVNSRYTELFDPYYRFQIITKDPDDNKFVDCAIIAQAEYIVTNDKHFDEVKGCKFPAVSVIDIQSFAEVVKNTL